MFIPAWAASSGVIGEIELVGNVKTRPLTILRELPFTTGDNIDEEILESGVQSVKDLALFRDVTGELIEQTDGTVTARITVVEKSYNFVLPKLNRNGDGDITTGVVWRSDNLFGRNQQSKFTVAYRTFDDSSSEDETQIRWEFNYPRIGASPYSLNLVVGAEETRLEEERGDDFGVYDRDRTFLRLLGGRWMTRDGPSQGLMLKAGPLYDDYEHLLIEGDGGLFGNPTVQALVLGLDAFYVHDRLLSRTGKHYGYEFVWSDEETGSDIDFRKHFFFYRRYIPIARQLHENLNLQFRAGYISQSVLGPPEFSIGGSGGIRGYSRETVEGNSFVILNVEWLKPILDKETLRGALIFDAGNAWEDESDASISDLRYSAGIGLRWKIQRFVKTDVRLDVAHGFSDGGETKVYLSTRATF